RGVGEQRQRTWLRRRVGGQLQRVLRFVSTLGGFTMEPEYARSSYARSEVEYALGSPRYRNRLLPVVVATSP
ncbi:MAG: hypothetical protein ACRD1X_19670, partial [Vicinamibacteria bacterium]